MRLKLTKKKNIEAWQSVTGSCKRENVVSIALIALEATVKRREIFAFLEISQNLEAYLQQFIFGKNELLYRYTQHSLLVSKQHHFKGYLLLNDWFCKTRIIIAHIFQDKVWCKQHLYCPAASLEWPSCFLIASCYFM